MPYESAGLNQPPHPLAELPTNGEIAAMVHRGRRLQSEACWGALVGMVKQTAPKPAVQPTVQTEQPALMWSMAKRLGIDEAQLLRDDFEIQLGKMMECCAACTKTDMCKSWLASERPNIAYRSFCANAPAIDALPRKAAHLKMLSLIKMVAATLYRRRVRRTEVDDLSALSDHILKDIGIHRSQIRSIIEERHQGAEISHVRPKPDVKVLATTADQ